MLKFFNKPKQQNTLNNKLGINVGELARNFLERQNGYLQKTGWNRFWEAMDEDATDLNIYLHILLQHLLQHLSNKKKLPFHGQVLLNTINFLTLRVSLPQSKQVIDIMQKWNKNRVKYESRSLASAKDVLSVLHKRLIEKKESLDSLVIQCHQFYSHQELAKIADYYTYPTTLHIINGIKNIGQHHGDKTFMWNYLKYLASNHDNFKLMLNLTIVKLRSIMGTVYLLPKLAEISLLALIHMVSQLISYYRVPEEGFISRSVSVLKTFYLWPVPYGTQARDLLLMLKKERVAPGLALIHRIWKESSLPEIILNSDNNNNKLSNSNNLKSTNNSDNNNNNNNSFRPLFYLMDSREQKSLLFSNIMFIDNTEEWGSSYSVNTGVNPYTCALLLLNIIKHEIGVSQKLLSSVKKLNENEIILFYKQVIEIFLSSAETDDPDLAKQSRREALAEIAKQIIEHSKDKDEDEENIDLEDLPKNYLPPLPILHHTGLVCDLEDMQYPKKGQIASGEITYPINSVLIKIRNILTKLSKLSSEKEPLTLRFMISGGNQILNSSICAYASLLRHYEGLLNQFNLEFFLFPTSDNNYAQWLSRMDPWYNRHVFTPLCSSLFVVPSVYEDTRLKRQNSGKINCFGKFYRELAETYTREASHIVQLFLWECQGWTDEPYTNTPDQVIPFCQRIDLGKEAEFEGQKLLFQNPDDESEYDEEEEYKNNNNSNTNNNNSYGESNYDLNNNNYSNNNSKHDPFVNNNEDGLDEKEELNINNFDFNPQIVTMEWECVDMIGKVSSKITQKGQRFKRLHVSITPRYGDKGIPPNPMIGGVAEMVVQLVVPKNTKKKSMQEYRLLQSEPNQHIRTVSIQINKGQERFWIKVDDKLYGPYARIKITPMINPTTNEQVFIPIKTFFPVIS